MYIPRSLHSLAHDVDRALSPNIFSVREVNQDHTFRVMCFGTKWLQEGTGFETSRTMSLSLGGTFGRTGSAFSAELISTKVIPVRTTPPTGEPGIKH